MGKIKDMLLVTGELIDYRDTIKRYVSLSSNRKDYLDAVNKVINIASNVREDKIIIRVSLCKDMGVHPSTLKKIVEKEGLFVCTDSTYCSYQKKAREYEATELLFKILDEHNPSPIMLSLRRSKGYNKNVQIPYNSVTDNIDSLVFDWYNEIKFNEDVVTSLKEYIDSDVCSNATRLHLQKLLNVLEASDGVVHCFYRRCATERLCTFGNTNVQSIPKEVREFMFKGLYDYDISNYTFTIASQMLERMTKEESTIGHYAYEPVRVRQQLALDIDVTPKQIKEALLMLAFGVSVRNTDPTSKLALLLGQSGRELFLEHPFVQNVMKELDLLTVYYKADLDFIAGETGRNLGKRQYLSYLFQNIEAKIMDVIIKEVSPYVVIFDGFISLKEVDTDLLSAKIEEQLGWKVEFTEGKFGSDYEVYQKWIENGESENEF